jgi:hypothetical protein
VVIANNTSGRTVELRFTAGPDLLNDIKKGWRLSHNHYLQPSAFPKGNGDILEDPAYLSRDPAHPDYLRLAAHSPLATAGAGGSWPSYIGALPPGPAPSQGDWFTTLRERWK